MNNEFMDIERRYVGHVEDEPMVWQKSSDDLDELIVCTEALVCRRNVENGAGEGVIIDTMTKRIVACFGMDIPNDEIEEAHVVDVVMRRIDS